MDEVICQFGAVCKTHCTHKWPHVCTVQSLGCDYIEGCNNRKFTYHGTFEDEFGQRFQRGELEIAYCVDFDYFIQNTGPHQVIVTRGTVYEGYLDRIEEWDRVEKERMRKKLAEQYERQRQELCDDYLSLLHQSRAYQQSLYYEPNPSLVKEEDRWIGVNWSARV